ncbi:hypothetical protein AB0425_22275 [Actinosynnema sp. NPDC051121]
MTDSFTAIAHNKQICTGVALSSAPPVRPNPLPRTEAAFDAMVSSHYTFFREEFRNDVAFLRKVEDVRCIGTFDKTVYFLRTAKQHQPALKYKIFYTEWARGRTWEEAAEAFLDQYTKALEALERVSRKVRRDLRLSKAWSDNASVEPERVFLEVCGDLNVRFDYGTMQRLVRNVSHRRDRLPVGTDVHAEVEQLCVQEIVAQDLKLPLPHHEILDSLGLLGKVEARAALLMAYAISAATKLTGEAFLERVKETWATGSC